MTTPVADPKTETDTIVRLALERLADARDSVTRAVSSADNAIVEAEARVRSLIELGQKVPDLYASCAALMIGELDVGGSGRLPSKHTVQPCSGNGGWIDGYVHTVRGTELATGRYRCVVTLEKIADLPR